MSKSARTKRPYNSTRRQAQAQETRQQIIAAARRLFIEHGYAGATIDAIAEEAGVAAETIFATFGNKRTILAELVRLAVGGDEQPIPLLNRPGPQTVLREPDPVRKLQLFAQDISTILERVAPLFAIIRVAAKTEPDMADLLKKILNDRLQNMIAVVKSVAARGPLRAGLDEMRAAEIAWTLTSPDVFNLLTTDRGWSKEQYSDWLGESLIRLLLP